MYIPYMYDNALCSFFKSQVVGDTMYNLLEMQKIDTDGNDRPVTPPSIIDTRIIINPFDDLFVRDLQKGIKEEKQKEPQAKKATKEAKKQPAVVKKKLNVLPNIFNNGFP